MPATSPVQVLGLILQGPAKTANQDIVLLDYRDPATFSALWLHGVESGEVDMGGQKIALTDSTKQFLIIGNDPPDGIFATRVPALAGIDFRSHFTATSWVAAWKVKFPDSKVSIAVLDPRESRHSHGAARALQAILGAKDAEGRSLIPSAGVLNAPNLAGICEWLKRAKDEDRALSKDTPHLGDLLKSTIWNELVGNAESHHSISNVLGAALLGGTDVMGDLGAPLIGLFACLGVRISPEGVEILEAGQPQPVDCPVLLFDDMADLWGEPLSRLFEIVGLNPQSISSPSVGNANIGALKRLLESLENCLRAPYCRHRLTMGDFGVEGELAETKDFVLLLDLRLFGLTADAKSDELNLFGRLYQAHEELSLAYGRDLPQPPWPGIRGGQWLDGLTSEEDFSTGYRKARALLPKLISLVDPTLPIVVFSSTHDGDVLGELTSHGNIVTRFSKPVFRGAIGDFREWHESICRNFREAIGAAVGILKTRRQLSRFSLPERAPVVPASAENAPTCVEIFLDESGSAHEVPFGIGGIVVISRNKSGFDHSAFARQLSVDNKLWGASKEFPFPERNRFPSQYATKGSGLPEETLFCDMEFGRVRSAAAEASGELYAFALIAEEPASQGVFSPKHPHHRYRSVLRDVLELLLFHFQPVVEALDQGAWLGIDAATWSPNWMSKWGDLTSAKQNLGIEMQGNSQQRYTGLRRADLFPLLIDVIHRSGVPCPWCSRIRRARAVQLVDFGRSDDISHALYSMPECAPHQIHYLADWIAHFATQKQRRDGIGEIGTLKKMFEKGWLQTRNPSFQAAFTAMRLWNQEKEVEALAEMEKVDIRPAKGDAWPWSFGRFYPSEFGSWMQRISGDKLRLSFAANR